MDDEARLVTSDSRPTLGAAPARELTRLNKTARCLSAAVRESLGLAIWRLNVVLLAGAGVWCCWSRVRRPGGEAVRAEYEGRQDFELDSPSGWKHVDPCFTTSHSQSPVAMTFLWFTHTQDWSESKILFLLCTTYFTNSTDSHTHLHNSSEYIMTSPSRRRIHDVNRIRRVIYKYSGISVKIGAWLNFVFDDILFSTHSLVFLGLCPCR